MSGETQSHKSAATGEEEDQIVAFLQTLADGYTTPYPNRDIFAGTCRMGGSVA